MPETRYFISLTNDLDGAHDGGIYHANALKTANWHCENLIVNTRKPWKVWPCIVSLPSRDESCGIVHCTNPDCWFARKPCKWPATATGKE